MIADRVTSEQRAKLRELVDAQHAASVALVTFQRELAVEYELRGKDSMDAFGFVTRDKEIAR